MGSQREYEYQQKVERDDHDGLAFLSLLLCDKLVIVVVNSVVGGDERCDFE